MRCDVSFRTFRPPEKTREGASISRSLRGARCAHTCRTVATVDSSERAPSKDRSRCASASNPRASDVNAASRGGLT